jgi:hypothetical protein
MTLYTATASQYASAASHLDRQADWRVYRFDGVRYVVLVSGCSGKRYSVRADAVACSCPWYEKTLSQCSHMLSVYLQATLEELETEAAYEQQTSKPRPSYSDLFPACAEPGCENDPESGQRFCREHWLADVF